eukprot:scaffold1377_cov126-Cylindrotheca_fusiformis.AAC.7
MVRKLPAGVVGDRGTGVVGEVGPARIDVVGVECGGDLSVQGVMKRCAVGVGAAEEVGVVFFMAAEGGAERRRFQLPAMLSLQERQNMVNPSDAKMLQVVGDQVLGESSPVDLGALRGVPVVGTAEAVKLCLLIGVWKMCSAV